MFAILAKVTAYRGSRMFEIELTDGRKVRRHLDRYQIRNRTNEAGENGEV